MGGLGSGPGAVGRQIRNLSFRFIRSPMLTKFLRSLMTLSIVESLRLAFPLGLPAAKNGLKTWPSIVGATFAFALDICIIMQGLGRVRRRRVVVLVLNARPLVATLRTLFLGTVLWVPM